MMLPYSQLIEQIVPGVTLTLKEYIHSRKGRQLTLSIANSVVHDVIPANACIGREQLEQYYGADLDDVDYLQLSSVNCFRAVLLIRLDDNNNPVYKPIFINQDFYESGLQEVELISGSLPEEPIYAPQILGQFEPSYIAQQPVRVPIITQESESHGETHLHFPSH